MRSLFVALFLSVVASGLAENYDNCPVPQVACTSSNCKLPDCSCSGSEPATALSDRPQLVYLTFDDAMTRLFDTDFYHELFMEDTYLNPNNCSMRSTFFVTHRSNDYQVTNEYWRHGHEIASHSITHRSNTTYWRLLHPQGWADEMDGARQMLTKFGSVPKDDIIGIRTPYLQGGGDEMFDMMQNNGFSYDCSAPSQLFGYTNMKWGRYPYTNDYENDMDCQIEPCPHCSYPGIWSQPLLDLEDNRDGPNGFGYPCAMADTCIVDSNPDSTYEMLRRNFDRAHNGLTKAPFGVYIHTAWFVGQEYHYIGYKKFLDYILSFPDVWVVPIAAGLEYFKNPMTNDDLTDGNFEPFQCDNYPKPDNCFPNSCRYQVDNEDIHGQEMTMAICGTKCPSNYPWLGNPGGD